MSDTPITDAVIRKTNGHVAIRDHARRMERDRAELMIVLGGMYQDQMDYISLNRLSGAENNHWMIAARAVLSRVRTK